MKEFIKLNGNEYLNIEYYEEVINNYLFTINSKGEKHSFKLNDKMLNMLELAEIRKGQLLAIKSVFDVESIDFIVKKISYLKSN